jgi:hypothetical protein
MSDNFFYNAYLNYLKIEFISTEAYKDDNNIQTIGYYDAEKKIWYNGWAIYGLSNNKIDIHKKSKELLIYALNLENDLTSYSEAEKMIIRSIICSSKIYITDVEEDITQIIENKQLEILLSVICYLIKAKKMIHYYANNIFVFAVKI